MFEVVDTPVQAGGRNCNLLNLRTASVKLANVNVSQTAATYFNKKTKQQAELLTSHSLNYYLCVHANKIPMCVFIYKYIQEASRDLVVVLGMMG